MAQYIPPKVAKRYGLFVVPKMLVASGAPKATVALCMTQSCATAWGMDLIPEEASSGAHGADGDTVWLAVGSGARVTHHSHVPAEQVRFGLH